LDRLAKDFGALEIPMIFNNEEGEEDLRRNKKGRAASDGGSAA
jgi:hypothetical protein